MEYVFCTTQGDINRKYTSIMEVQNLKKNKVFHEVAMIGNIGKETSDQDLMNVLIFCDKIHLSWAF